MQAGARGRGRVELRSLYATAATAIGASGRAAAASTTTHGVAAVPPRIGVAIRDEREERRVEVGRVR